MSPPPSNFLWDKTAYSLGVTAGNDRRTAEKHREFVDFHRKTLAGTTDEGLSIFTKFIEYIIHII